MITGIEDYIFVYTYENYYLELQYGFSEKSKAGTGSSTGYINHSGM